MISLLAQATDIGDYIALLFFPFLPLIPLAVWLGLRWQHRQAERRLQHWAERSGYQILDRSYRLFIRGPFYWCSDSGQAVYRIAVADPAGNHLSGWVRFGDWWWGIQSDKIAVLWDKKETVV